MDKQMDKSLFFLTLSCVCVWLVVDLAVGKKHLQTFLSTIFPFMAGDSSSTTTSVTLDANDYEVAEKSDTAIKNGTDYNGGATFGQYRAESGSKKETSEKEESSSAIQNGTDYNGGASFGKYRK